MGSVSFVDVPGEVDSWAQFGKPAQESLTAHQITPGCAIQNSKGRAVGETVWFPRVIKMRKVIRLFMERTGYRSRVISKQELAKWY